MSAWLTTHGHEIHVITAPPYYPDWKIWPGFSQWRILQKFESGIKVWRCPLFVPVRPTALKRILHLASFAISSWPALFMQIFWRPDVLLLVAPTLFCAPQALLLAKLTGSKSILHIQDFEVDALFGLELGLGSVRRIWLIRLAYSLEALILKAFDLVSTISEGMVLRALKKGVASERLFLFSNWSEVSRFNAASRSDELLLSLGVDPGKKIILYSGNMGEKQGLELILQTAQKLKFNNDIVFLMVGEGASKNRLIQMSMVMGLSNVIFAPLQSYDHFPELLASADVHLVIQKKGIADAVLPSKITNIFASGGNAVITADPMTTLGVLGSDNPGIAVIIEPESMDALLQGIEQALELPLPNLIATAYAKKFLDKDKVLNNFLNKIQA